ncbi:ParB/RepB/Spo0J family partition protein [bacterium]|nr:MAG: ParB/RepB/Spo0J family partition protein [bacterium]
MRKALGKGLSQLLGEQFDGQPVEASVDSIVPNARQPRTVFEDAPLKELAASIRQHGVLQPLVVRTISEGKYELIAGERRLRASKLAGLTTVPIHVRAAGSQESLELALVENIQREDINPVEAARAYRRLIDEFGLTQEEVAEQMRKARATVTNTLRLLKLPGEALEALENGAITEGHARALLAFSTLDKQIDVLERILVEGMSVRQVEELARPKPLAAPRAKPILDADTEAFQDALGQRLGSPVRIAKGRKGGKITIPYFSDEDLVRLAEVLGVQL